MAVRLFVGNMPYGATDADLRSHFSAVGEPSHVVIPVDRETGRPTWIRVRRVPRSRRGRAGRRAIQPAALHGTQPVGRARRVRVKSDRPAAASARVPARQAAAALVVRVRRSRRWRSAVRGLAAPAGDQSASRWRWRMAFGALRSRAGKNFGPPKKKTAGSEKRWESKERGPKGPIKERYTGRLGGLDDDPADDAIEPVESLGDFDDVASSRAGDDENEK